LAEEALGDGGLDRSVEDLTPFAQWGIKLAVIPHADIV
jgi:hypothetical protein